VLPTESLLPSVSEEPSSQITNSLSPSVSEAPSSQVTNSLSPSVSEEPSSEVTSSFVPSFTEEPSSEVTSSSLPVFTMLPSLSSISPSSSSVPDSTSPTFEPSELENNQTAVDSETPSSSPSVSLAPSQQTSVANDTTSDSDTDDILSAQNAINSWYIPVDDDGLSAPNVLSMVVNTGIDCTRSSLNAPYKQIDRAKYPLLYVQLDKDENTREIVTRQSLLRIDLSSDRQRLPTGVSITKATLRIRSTRVNNPIHVAMHRVLVPWEDTEKDATSGGIFFGLGTNHNAVPAAHQLLSTNGQQAMVEPSVEFFGTHREVLELDVTDDVKFWVDGGPNHGWLFVPAKEDEYGRWGMWGLDSPSNRPELHIQYSE
jgi:hypothetical protein